MRPIQERPPSRLHVAANDNNPTHDKTTIMAPHNGGCSTTSGLRAVSVQRVPESSAEDAADMEAGLAVTEYALRQVAA